MTDHLVDFIQYYRSSIIKEKDQDAEGQRNLIIGIPGGGSKRSNQFECWNIENQKIHETQKY